MIAEQFEHGADVGVRGRGATPEEAFVGAALALERLLAEDLEAVRPEVEERIAVSAPDLEQLLVAFLNEIVYLSSARRLVFGSFAVRISGGAGAGFRAEASARGERIDPERHAATVEPKGATFTALRVAREEEGWVAQCVVDV